MSEIYFTKPSMKHGIDNDKIWKLRIFCLSFRNIYVIILSQMKRNLVWSLFWWNIRDVSFSVNNLCNYTFDIITLANNGEGETEVASLKGSQNVS